MPPSTTRGIRTCQTMSHCVSLTPLSMWTPGTWSSSASGTRHHAGPAGPSITPTRNATRNEATATSDQRRPWPWRAGAATASVEAVGTSCVATASAGGDGDLLESIVDLARVVDDARTPAGGDVVVHREDVALLDGGDVGPAGPALHRLQALAAALRVGEEDQIGVGVDDRFLAQLREAGRVVGRVGDVGQAEHLVDLTDERVRPGGVAGVVELVEDGQRR